ncbi:hypothetical protein U27_02970 [Candidatus Vecturithrix granuli]|uniref:Uncharacterized protein n=1 Tax=Vecturithrix granuli TaxID=1499967 RepID=A0A081BUK4_VECG1|nr:hypothetical protein U27_02970 [Candidatus Vecturithrix granuli]
MKTDDRHIPQSVKRFLLFFNNRKTCLLAIGQTFLYEVKSFTNERDYHDSLIQAARYGNELGLTEITLVFFVESIDDANRAKYEVVYQDKKTGVTVHPFFVQIEL